MKKAIIIWGKAFNILREYPRIIIPFAITGICNALALYIVYLAPQRPVIYLFGPPIKTFWGMKFLHYPFNLYLLPKLFYYASICVGATVGMLMTAVAIGMVKDFYSDNIPSFFPNLLVSLKRYFALFGIWFITFVFSFYSVKAVGHLANGAIMRRIVPYIIYAVSITAQTVFIYAVPVLIIERKRMIASITKGVMFLKRTVVPTLILVLLPAILYLPILVLRQKGSILMAHLYPEIIITIIGLEILVSFIIDVLITIFITLMFIEEKDRR